MTYQPHQSEDATTKPVAGSAGERPAMSMYANAADYNAAMDEWLASKRVPGPLAVLLAAVRPMVAMTREEALEKDHHGMRFMYCQCDALNPCWDNRPDDVPGQHWGGGDACPECTLRAAIARAAGAEA